MKKTVLVAVAAFALAGAASAAPALQPFKSPAVAAQRLVRVLNSQLVTKATRCRVVNPYRVDCTTRYQRQPAKIVWHKLNPYMLLMDTYILGGHTVSRYETKVAY